MSKEKQLLTEEEWAEWRQHPVTQGLWRLLSLARKERKDEWEEGNFVGAPRDQQMLLNAAALGECRAYKKLEELTLDQLRQELEDAAE